MVFISSLRAFLALLAIAFVVSAPAPLKAQRLMENLGRGVVAVRTSSTQVFLSWRLLGVEPANLGFNVYRSTGGGAAVKLNDAPLVGGTNYTDSTADLAQSNAYTVRPIVAGIELAASAPFTLPANTPVRQFLSIPLQPAGNSYVHLIWVGDLDGDGEYDFIVSRMPNTATPHQLDAYKRDGTFLWRVNFGPNSVNADNIEPPASAINAGHNDGVTVYDLDCDGRAEVIVKSANGVVFGDGTTLTYGDDITQFISVLDGLTGAERARAPVPTDYISDGPVSGHFGIAYLDGVKPSFVFKAKNRIGNGAFNLFTTTWDFDGVNLTQRWKWRRDDEPTPCPDNHQIRIVDVDGDGKDEICDGGFVLDDDGTLLYSLGSAGIVHGDRFHIGDLDPDRPGLEGFGIQQNNPSGLLYYVYDAANGALIHTHFGGVEDTARGTAADITSAHRGYEYWSFHGIHEIKTGSVISPNPQRPWPNFRIWWDGDTLSENLNREIVEKWNPATGGVTRLLTASNDGAVDSWRDAAQFYGDIMGDWREEIVFERSDHSAIMIFTTTAPTATRLYTLPHNPEYRACFTVKGYLQSNMLDYYLGDGMVTPPAPNIVPVQAPGATLPVITGFSTDTGESPNDRITADSTPTLTGTAPAGATVILSHIGGPDDGSTVANGSGQWSFTYATSLADGTHYFTARLDDGANNLSWPFDVEIDTTPPAMPAIDAVVLEGNFSVFGSATAGTRVEVSIDGLGPIGTTTADAGGQWSITSSAALPPAGGYTFSALARDVAGNPSAIAERAIDSSITAPAIASASEDTGVSANDRITADTTLVLQGAAAPGATVSLYRFGFGALGDTLADASGTWSFDYTGTVLSDGAYAFTAFSGTSPGSPTFTITVDTTPPAVTAIDRFSPSAASGSAEAITFRLAGTETLAGVDASDFTAVFGGGLTGALASVNAAGATAFDILVSGFSGEGTVRVDLNATGTGITDLAGNAIAGGFTTGQTFTRALLGNGVWLRTVPGGLWSANANWEGGIVAHGTGTTADFSTIEIPEDNIVHLDSPRSVTNVIFGDDDPTSAASWTIDDNGNASNTLTLVAGTASPVVTVNALGTGARATISARIAGTGGIVKAGAGTLVLTGNNPVTGTSAVTAGVLAVGPGGTFTPGTVNISTGGATLNVAGGTLNSTGTTNVTGSASRVIVDSGTATFATIAGSNNTGSLVRVNGGTFQANAITFMRSTDGSLNYGTGFVVAGGTATVGSITLGTNNSNAMMSVEGGSTLVTGVITLGNQSSGGRGGHLRVTGGTFTSTDAATGLIVTRRNNNASTANFLGGVSTIERAILGFDGAVTSGSGTLNVNGGALYLGSGGIVSNAGGTFAANINLTSGVLGAKASWSTARAVTLPTGGNIQLKTANAIGTPFDITLTGVLSGAGGFSKTGAGTLTLGGANTFGGAASVSEGTLNVTGSLAGSSPLTVSAGATLAGNGAVNRPMTLLTGSALAPTGALSGASLSWEGGALARFDLGADVLTLTGELTKGAAGAYEFEFAAPTPPAAGTVCPLINYGSTTFVAEDFTFSGIPGLKGVFQAGSGALAFLVTGSGPSAEFTHWAYLAGLSFGQNGPTDDPDGDGVANLLEFIHGLNPLLSDADGAVVIVVAAGGGDYPALKFRRNQTLGGVAMEVRASTSLEFASDLGTVEVSATPQPDGTDEVVVRSLIPLSQERRQFLRIFASLPGQ